MLEFHWFYKGQGSRGAAEGAEGAEAGGGRGRGPKSALFAPKLLFRKNAKIPQKSDFFAKMRLWTPKVHFRPQGAPKPLIFHWFNKPLRARARKAAFPLNFTLFSSFSHFGAKKSKKSNFLLFTTFAKMGPGDHTFRSTTHSTFCVGQDFGARSRHENHEISEK